MVRRFNHWAYLNEEGMIVWGAIFPTRTVPVVSMIWTTGELGEPGNVEDYYKVQWDELKEKQQKAIVDLLADKFNAPAADIEKQIEEIGLPLRRSLTNGSGTNHPGLLL